MNTLEIEKYLDSINFGSSFDQSKRLLTIDNQKIFVCYLTSLAAGLIINDLIDSLTNLNNINDLANQTVNGSVQYVKNINDAQTSLFSGCAVIFIEGDFGCFIIETRQYPTRGVSEPDTEKTIRGSKDGFNENIITNVGLIRRRIREKDFIIEKYEANDYSKTMVAVCYIKKRVDQKLLNTIKNQIETVQIKNLVMSDRALEEAIMNQNYHPFPFVRYSERPDIVASHIAKGQIAIIVDTSPSVIICPTSYFDHLEHVEEHRQTPIVGTILRIIRYFAIFLSIYLVPLWLIAMQNDAIHFAFLIRPEIVNRIPLYLQAIIVELAIEFLRLASIHTPSQIASTMGLIAAILLGDTAITLGVFMPEVLLYVAIANIGGFVTSSYELSLANKLTRFFFILSIALFGATGFILGNFIFFFYLATLQVFKYHYLYPLIPLNIKALTNILIRKPK